MSSPTKDARWYLATEFVEDRGFAWENFSYDDHVVFLEAAQLLIDKMPQTKIKYYSDLWNHND